MDEVGGRAGISEPLAQPACDAAALEARAIHIAQEVAAECRRSYWYPLPGLLRVPLPNFGWRRRALLRHDLHHLLTGYPHTPLGEMEMAAWEFAAGRFEHAGATAFCLPLVGLGAALSPRRTRAAFVRGRRSTSLYANPLPDREAVSRILEWRRQVAMPAGLPASRAEGSAYRRLVALSFAWMLAPPALLVLAAWAAAR